MIRRSVLFLSVEYTSTVNLSNYWIHFYVFVNLKLKKNCNWKKKLNWKDTILENNLLKNNNKKKFSQTLSVANSKEIRSGFEMAVLECQWRSFLSLSDALFEIEIFPKHPFQYKIQCFIFWKKNKIMWNQKTWIWISKSDRMG